MILNVNAHCMNLAFRQAWLRRLLNSAPIVFCDGEGVRIAAKLLGYSIPQKITYNRWIWDLANLSEQQGFTWYLVGAKENIIEKAVLCFKHHYPKLNIVGFHSGYFLDMVDIERVVNDINKKRPNILIIGMGMPIQERWLSQYFSRLDINIALTAGAVFDYVSGQAKMTPDFFYKLKLEWLFRFIHEPRRLFRRYIIGNPLFFFRLLRYRLSGLYGVDKKRCL
jgi:N-acetylglucosaminyldiphosphoundecaprenol N-acetyl-beta-D-mannosaminyltransferase